MIADGAVTTVKIANDATEPSRIQSWADDTDYLIDATGSSPTNIIDPGIVFTVPAGEAYYYVVV